MSSPNQWSKEVQEIINNYAHTVVSTPTLQETIEAIRECTERIIGEDEPEDVINNTTTRRVWFIRGANDLRKEQRKALR